MLEGLPFHPDAVVDPSLLAGSTLGKPELQIRFNTFEEAQVIEKHFPDSFVEGVIANKLKVGNETIGVKGYLDVVEATQSDNEIIANPDAIAALYLKTTEMLARNIIISVVRNADPAIAATRNFDLSTARERLIKKLHDEAQVAAKSIVDWCDGKIEFYPTEAMEYNGLKIDVDNPLNPDLIQPDDFRLNFMIQRQANGAFIMAYSEHRVAEKLSKQDQELVKRIYLNPETAVTPDIFEEILTTANQAGLSIQLKMFQRAPEFATGHLKRKRGKTKDGFRGDGIVVYAGDEEADDVLAMVLAIAKKTPEAFAGRETSKIPQSVAEGIAIGDEPTQMPGTSLTSHRVEILQYAATYVRESNKTGTEANDLFRKCLAATAKANKVDPHNIAFNVAP